MRTGAAAASLAQIFCGNQLRARECLGKSAAASWQAGFQDGCCFRRKRGLLQIGRVTQVSLDRFSCCFRFFSTGGKKSLFDRAIQAPNLENMTSDTSSQSLQRFGKHCKNASQTQIVHKTTENTIWWSRQVGSRPLKVCFRWGTPNAMKDSLPLELGMDRCLI